MEGAARRPFINGSRGPQLGGLAAVACRNCGWAQAVNEDLHEGYEDRLLAWHAANPRLGFDHLADRDPARTTCAGRPWSERHAGVGKLIHEVSATSMSTGDPGSGEHRSLTLRVVLRPTEATLTAEETGVIRTHMVTALSQELRAHLR